MCLISFKYDAKSKAWDILLVLTSVAGNLCNKCPSGYSNKTAVKVILSMRSCDLWSLSNSRAPGGPVTHASRPQEGSGDHRNESTNGQAETSIVSRYGKLHGDLHSKPLTSH